MILLVVAIFLFTSISMFIYMKYADKFGLIDIPNERSMHQEPIPRGAGIAFISSILLALIFFNFEYLKTYYYVYLAIIIVFSVGIWDDLKNISPNIKFIFIFFASVLLYMNHIAIYSLGIYFGHELILPTWFIFPLTFFAIAGYTNALNLMDGLDGLAASISIVILVVFFIIGIEYSDMLITSLSSFFIVSLLVFLWFNWYPAKVFMGDSGALSLGMVISILGVQSIKYISPTAVLFIVALPILDTFIVMTRRIQRHQSPFKADKNHLHHFLFKIKGDVGYTVTILVILQMIFSLIGYQVRESNDFISLILFGLLFIILLNLFDQRLKRRKRS